MAEKSEDKFKEGVEKVLNSGINKVINVVLEEAIKNIAMLELEKNSENNAGYRNALMDAVRELKKLKQDE